LVRHILAAEVDGPHRSGPLLSSPATVRVE
jgi:hypothetical protein